MHALTGSKDLLFVLATARTEMIKNVYAYKKYHKRVSDIKFEGTQTLGPKDHSFPGNAGPTRIQRSLDPYMMARLVGYITILTIIGSCISKI